MAQFWTPKSENSLKIHSLSLYIEILHAYTHMNLLSNKLSPTQFG